MGDAKGWQDLAGRVVVVHTGPNGDGDCEDADAMLRRAAWVRPHDIRTSGDVLEDLQAKVALLASELAETKDRLTQLELKPPTIIIRGGGAA